MADLVPSKIRIETGAAAALSDAAGATPTDVPLASAILPPQSFGDTYYASGLLAALFCTPDTDAIDYTVRVYDLATGDLVALPALEVNVTGSDSPNAAGALPFAGLSPLQRGRNGWATFYLTDDATPAAVLRVLLSQYVTETGGTRRLVTGEATYGLAQRIVDASPLSKTSDLYLLLGLAQTAEGAAQVHCVKATIDDTGWPASPGSQALLTLAEFWSQEYTAAFWLNRPDTCLAVQATPAVASLTQQIVMLLGNWETPTIHNAVSDPRIVLADLEGKALWSHEFGYGNAHGMIVNQFGDIFVVGTRDIVNDGPFLICRYSTRNLGETERRVEHGAGGLGAYAGDPSETHVVTPMWTGSRLIVQDHGPSATSIYVYDRDLNLIKSFALSSTASPGGPRFRGSNKATAWWGESY